MKLQLVKMSLFPDFTFIHPKLYVAELHEYCLLYTSDAADDNRLV